MIVKQLEWKINSIYNRAYANCPILGDIAIWFDDCDDKFKSYVRQWDYEIKLGTSYTTIKYCQKAIEKMRKKIILECIE